MVDDPQHGFPHALPKPGRPLAQARIHAGQQGAVGRAVDFGFLRRKADGGEYPLLGRKMAFDIGEQGGHRRRDHAMAGAFVHERAQVVGGLHQVAVFTIQHRMADAKGVEPGDGAKLIPVCRPMAAKVTASLHLLNPSKNGFAWTRSPLGHIGS